MQPSDEAPLREVFLYGHLALDIGKRLELAFRTPADAIRLIELNWPGFAQRFKSGLFHLSITRDGAERELDLEHVTLGFTGDALHIMPRAVGRGKGKAILTALIGGLVIGAAFFFSGGTLGAALPGFLGATGATFGTVANFGMGLVLNGIGSLLTPTPKTDYQEEGKKSFIFNGPINTSDQGGPVPLVFGRMMIGSIVASASLDVENDATENDQKALSPALNFNRPGSTAGGKLDMGDLVEITEGAVLTKVGTTTIGASGSMTQGAFVIQYSKAGQTYNPGGVEGGDSRYDPKKYNIWIRWTGTSSTAMNLPFEVTHEGKVYAGVIKVTARDTYDNPGYAGGNR